MPGMLSTYSLCKSFPGVTALRNVSICLQLGKIYGLVGENGAGKSTLIKVLMGVHKPDDGYIMIRGKKLTSIKDSSAARNELKIDAVFQESSLIDNLSVAENLFIDRLDKFRKRLLLDKGSIKKECEKVLQKIPVALDLDGPAGSLREDVKKLVEFSRILISDPDVVILDEVTAPLERTMVKRLFSLMREFKKAGKAVVFVSHRLDEVFEICDEIIVLRAGKVEAITENEGAGSKSSGRDSVIRMMTGVEIDSAFPQRTGLGKPRSLVLSTKVLGNEYLRSINLDLYAGEIVGLAGLSGQGQSMLLRTLAGLIPKKTGEVYVEGNRVDIRTPNDAMRNGLFYLSDMRDEEELWLSQDVVFNICSPSLKERSTMSFVRRSIERQVSDEIVSRLRVETPSLAQIVRNLSGGNRQKVILGRKLLSKPRIFLADQPTKGLDVPSKMEIYSLMRKLASEDRIPILTVLTDLPEVVNLPDRILVMREGAIVREFSGPTANEDTLLDSYFG
jgi:ABC-type sugar transport system ATPase subunit